MVHSKAFLLAQTNNMIHLFPSMKSNLCLSSIILFSLLSLASSQRQYVVPNRYFINCGSNSDIGFTGKHFVGDDSPSTFSVSGSHKAVQNNSSPTPIYQTARVFTKKTTYNLEADDKNTFVMVRLHFSPFSTNEFELHNSIINVQVFGFSLLSNYKVESKIVIKDFIVPIGNDKNFRLDFTPSNGSYAFVNAIEAFTTPNDLFIDGTAGTPRVSPKGPNGDMYNISTSYAFNPIYRINVGGRTINDSEGDPLRRSWTPDEPFLFSNVSAKSKSKSDMKPSYDPKGAAPYIAPVDVYSTARRLTDKAVNMTWNFRVNKNSMFLLRAHFCDFMSLGLFSVNDAFSLFIYSLYKKDIPLGKIVDKPQFPFYVDFVVDSGEFDNVSISIGAIRGNSQTVFLNGLEIMELLTNSGVVALRTDGKKNEKKVHIVIGCVVGGVVLVLVLGFLIGSKYLISKPVLGAKRESNMVSPYGRILSISIDFTKNHSSPIPNLNLNLKFQLADILQATNNFDEMLMIGKGGFGKVYKGTLSDGITVAVKRGEKGHGQGQPEFVTEIMVLSKIRHRHLVSLIGYCDEKSEMILVYEFMKKGTLQDHLYDTNENLPKLSWTQRLEICISASRGLDYLHTGAGIIHRDVKSTNILLDENYVAKVADFGISRLNSEDDNEVSGIKGSFGYLDPEYITCMEVTPKIDVYSFGVVLLEVLCARRALDNRLPYEEANLADWATTRIRNGEIENIIDPFLVGKINPNSLRKFLEIVERCIKPTGDERPSMNTVLYDLLYTMELQQTMAIREPHEDSTINTSFQLSMTKSDLLPSHTNDYSEVNESSDSNFPSESQVFSQLKMNEAR